MEDNTLDIFGYDSRIPLFTTIYKAKPTIDKATPTVDNKEIPSDVSSKTTLYIGLGMVLVVVIFFFVTISQAISKGPSSERPQRGKPPSPRGPNAKSSPPVPKASNSKRTQKPPSKGEKWIAMFFCNVHVSFYLNKS